MLAEHRRGHLLARLALATYVPRFYGMRADELFASTVTEDEARLAVARTYGYPSWEELLERTAAEAQQRPGDWEVDPMRYASEAMEAADLDELRRVVDV